MTSWHTCTVICHGLYKLNIITKQLQKMQHKDMNRAIQVPRSKFITIRDHLVQHYINTAEDSISQSTDKIHIGLRGWKVSRQSLPWVPGCHPGSTILLADVIELNIIATRICISIVEVLCKLLWQGWVQRYSTSLITKGTSTNNTIMYWEDKWWSCKH